VRCIDDIVTSPLIGWRNGRRIYSLPAAGRDTQTFIKTLERMASRCYLLPEQVWDEADRPEFFLYSGRPTGSAMPLTWAHAEYIKLLRSVRDGAVFDQVAAAADRYRENRRATLPLEVWKFNWRARAIRPGWILRVQADAAFVLHWTADEWRTVCDTPSTPTAVAIDFADIPVLPDQKAPVRFTFRWINTGQWEGRDFTVAISHNM
jgi:glucoamylase